MPDVDEPVPELDELELDALELDAPPDVVVCVPPLVVFGGVVVASLANTMSCAA